MEHARDSRFALVAARAPLFISNSDGLDGSLKDLMVSRIKVPTVIEIINALFLVTCRGHGAATASSFCRLLRTRPELHVCFCTSFHCYSWFWFWFLLENYSE